MTGFKSNHLERFVKELLR